MVKYKNGKIYKLVNDVDNFFYVGSTCIPLKKRLSNHKSSAKIKINRNVYKHLNNIGWDHVTIELIENCPCKTKKKLLGRERYHIKKCSQEGGNKLNKHVPLQTKKESNNIWMQNNKNYFKKWRTNNKAKINAYAKEYYKNNKDKIQIWKTNNKDKVKAYVQKYKANNEEKIKQIGKKYRDLHKEKIKDYNKKWYQENKVKISALKKIYYQKLTCGKHPAQKGILSFEKKDVV